MLAAGKILGRAFVDANVLLIAWREGSIGEGYGEGAKWQFGVWGVLSLMMGERSIGLLSSLE